MTTEIGAKTKICPYLSRPTSELKAKDDRIAELEQRDKILSKALEESDRDAKAATEKWIAETKILLDKKEAAEKELATMHEVSVNLQRSRQKCIEHIEELEGTLNSLKAIAENPKWAISFRDFLRAAMDGKLNENHME